VRAWHRDRAVLCYRPARPAHPDWCALGWRGWAAFCCRPTSAPWVAGSCPYWQTRPARLTWCAPERQGTVKCAQALLSSSAATPDVK